MVINSFNSNLCIVCGYAITDPVCRNCYIKQTLILLNDLKISSMISNFIVTKLKNKLSSETLNDTECILCNKNTVTICRYCFSVNLIMILRELNFIEELIKNFYYNPMYEDISLEDESTLDTAMVRPSTF